MPNMNMSDKGFDEEDAKIDTSDGVVVESLDKDKKLSPNQIVYSHGEEVMNRITHLVGAVLALIASILCILKVATSGLGALAVVAIVLYCVSLINLYVMSTLYHWQPIGKVRRAVFRRFDHCSVALLIAGTYAPFMLIGLSMSGLHADFIWGIVIASVVLAMAVLVIIFNAINVSKFKIFCMIAYIIMGWACVIRMAPLFKAIGVMCFTFLLAGGVAYTVGILFYRAKKLKFNHAIWHLFVLAGSILHFIAIYFYLF